MGLGSPDWLVATVLPSPVCRLNFIIWMEIEVPSDALNLILVDFNGIKVRPMTNCSQPESGRARILLSPNCTSRYASRRSSLGESKPFLVPGANPLLSVGFRFGREPPFWCLNERSSRLRGFLQSRRKCPYFSQ